MGRRVALHARRIAFEPLRGSNFRTAFWEFASRAQRHSGVAPTKRIFLSRHLASPMSKPNARSSAFRSRDTPNSTASTVLHNRAGSRPTLGTTCRRRQHNLIMSSACTGSSQSCCICTTIGAANGRETRLLHLHGNSVIPVAVSGRVNDGIFTKVLLLRLYGVDMFKSDAAAGRGSRKTAVRRMCCFARTIVGSSRSSECLSCCVLRLHGVDLLKRNARSSRSGRCPTVGIARHLAAPLGTTIRGTFQLIQAIAAMILYSGRLPGCPDLTHPQWVRVGLWLLQLRLSVRALEP